MATNTSDVVDYLGEYRRYFEEFVGKINPEDQLPMKVNAYSITESELVGEIIYLTLQYIKQPRCPRNLQGYLVRLVLQEIKELCKKQPEECGFKSETKTYAPLKLMQTVTSKVNEIFTRYLDNNRLAMLPPPSSKLPPIARSAAFKNGKRKMEDRHIEIYDLHTICNVQNDSLASYFAVFDGHGGEDAAVYCASHLHQYLAESIYYPTDPEHALSDAFHTTDTRFIEKERTQRIIGGTTAVCVLLLDKKLYIAWVGDSLATLVKRGKVEELVYPHRLSRCDESERIRQMGGILAFNQGTMRVNGVLAVSRAIGDVQYKPYVTSVPDTQCVPLDGTEDFLIIATDGVWDFIKAHEAAAIVYFALRQYPDDPDYAATSLIKAAKYAGSLDNITAIVVFLTAPSEIASRPSDAHPLLSLDSMINMAVNNPYVQKDLCAIDGMFFKQMKQYQQHPPAYDNDQDERHANGSEASMDDGGFHDEITASAESKNEENDAADYIYEDLGPETDVDAVDDVDNVLENPILNNTPAGLSQGLFLEEKRLPENENDFRLVENPIHDEPLDESHDVTVEASLDDDDLPPSVINNDTKLLQHALLPEADNVADSEDSEDEWNYYRVGPNKAKDTEASSDEVQEIKNDNQPKNVERLDEDNNVERLSSASEVNSECESQKEEISPELINTDISVEENREVDFPFVKTEKEKEQEEENEEEGEGEHGGEEEEKQEDEDMEFQLNPNAAEFIPGSPPKHQLKRSGMNDSLVAGSPLKSMAMDDIMIPSQKEFDAEISVRPREMEEEKDSPNGDHHVIHSDYDFYTERQKISGVPTGLDESEISSTKAEFGDESNMSSLYTTDMHKTGISTIEESFGEPECDIYNRDNPMTMSFTPCDFKAAFKKEVDLNAVHNLSDEDLDEENCSYELQTPRSPVIPSVDIEHQMESSAFSNGDSLDRVQSSSGSLHDEATFLKFGDSQESRTTEFMQEELERHQSSPIDQAFGQDDILRQEKESHSIEDSDHVVNVTQAEIQQMETQKEANYIEDEKDFAENDVVTSEKEQVVEKPVEVPTEDLIQPEIPQETLFQDHNFLSSTVHEAQKSISFMESTPKSMSPFEGEHIETSSKPLEADVISSMENLAVTKEEIPFAIVSNLNIDVSDCRPEQSSFDIFASGEPLSCKIAKASMLEGSMDLKAEPTQLEQPVESSFVPTLTSEPVSDERPTENLLDFSETKTEMPTKDHIEETKVEESCLPTFEESANKPLQDTDESVCLLDMNKKAETETEQRENVKTSEEFDDLAERINEMNIADDEKVTEIGMLNLSESIQEFTGLEKQLEPENVTSDELPITEEPTIEEKTPEEVVEHVEPVVQETTDEKMLLDTKDEEILKAKEVVDVHVEEITKPVDITEVTIPSKTEEIDEPVDNSEIPVTTLNSTETEASVNITELVTPADTTEVETPVDTAEIRTPADTTETATPVDTAEIVMPTDTAETAKAPADTAEVVPVDSAEVATLADIAKAVTTANIVEAEVPTNVVDNTTTTMKTVETVETVETAKTTEISEPMPTVREEQKESETVKPVESSKVEETLTSNAIIITGAATTVAAVAAAAVGVVTAAATSTSKAKAKPTAKTTKLGTSTIKKTPQSTPTSPSKSVSPTTRSTTASTTMKRTPTTSATRPKLLDTAATKAATPTSAAKASAATKTVSSSKPATSTTKTAATRPSSAVTKAKPISASTTKTTTSSASTEKKSVVNGDVKSLSKGTTTKPASKPTTVTSTTASASAKTSATKTTTMSKSPSSATTTTMTKPRAISATTSARSPAKTLGTNSTTPNAAKTKTTPISNNTTKLRTTPLAKSPMIDKQIKETANKQISSMARTTSSAVSKTTARTSMSSTTVKNVTASTTKRLASSKSPSSATAHSSVKKIASKVASGNSSGTKTTSSTTKVKVTQNGTADNVELTKTTIITNIKNEDDVPKKDLSPDVAPTDNQLIVNAD